MFRPASSFQAAIAAVFLILAGPGAAAAALPAASQPAATPEPAESVRARRARARLKANPPALEREAAAPRDMPAVDPALIDFYRDTVTELADPAYEGRAPGSVGIERAAEFIEARFRDLGLTPAFAVSELAADGTEVLTPRATFRQHFGVGERTAPGLTELVVDGEPLTPDVDFSVLAYSGSGQTQAPLAFAGYAIVSGPGGYLGFDPNARFEDRIALALAYEPMDEEGNSRWQEDGFSHHAQLTHKASALIRRGAKAVLIVKPPHARDPRVETLETVESTSLARPGLNATAPRFDAPVLQITAEVAQRLLDRAGDPDLTVESLVERANAGPVRMDLPGGPIRVNVQMETTEIPAFNVGAVLPGVGDLADEFVVVGAHYDHVGYGLQNSLARNRVGDLHPGADDNASGTTGMLLIAQAVTERVRTLDPDAPRRSFLFLAFSAEEMGLLGSLHYARNPIAAIDRHAVMLNLDMIGRLENKPLEVGGLESAPALAELAEPHFERSGLVVARGTSVGSGRSDHASFDAVGVPNLFFFTGLHPQYHRPEDTADLIDAEGGTRVALLAADIAMDAATAAQPFVHRRRTAEAEARANQPTVRVGLLPANSTKGGILVQRVFPDTSASDADLRPGDRLLTWNGRELRSVEDLRPRLTEHAPGDTVTLTVERDGGTVEVEMTLRGIE